MIFCYFVIISPWKLVWPFMWTNFVPSLVEIGPVVLEKMIKLWKVYRQTDRWQAIRKAHLCFQLKWAKKNSKTKENVKKIQYLWNIFHPWERISKSFFTSKKYKKCVTCKVNSIFNVKPLNILQVFLTSSNTSYVSYLFSPKESEAWLAIYEQFWMTRSASVEFNTWCPSWTLYSI